MLINIIYSLYENRENKSHFFIFFLSFFFFSKNQFHKQLIKLSPKSSMYLKNNYKKINGWSEQNHIKPITDIGESWRHKPWWPTIKKRKKKKDRANHRHNISTLIDLNNTHYPQPPLPTHPNLRAHPKEFQWREWWAKEFQAEHWLVTTTCCSRVTA